MEIKTIEDSKKRFIFELKGATNGFCNALKDELWTIKGVTAAAYSKKHPMIGVPQLIIETDGSITPKEAITKATDSLKKKNKSFKEKALKALA